MNFKHDFEQAIDFKKYHVAAIKFSENVIIIPLQHTLPFKDKKIFSLKELIYVSKSDVDDLLEQNSFTLKGVREGYGIVIGNSEYNFYIPTKEEFKHNVNLEFNLSFCGDRDEILRYESALHKSKELKNQITRGLVDVSKDARLKFYYDNAKVFANELNRTPTLREIKDLNIYMTGESASFDKSIKLSTHKQINAKKPFIYACPTGECYLVRDLVDSDDVASLYKETTTCMSPILTREVLILCIGNVKVFCKHLHPHQIKVS